MSKITPKTRFPVTCPLSKRDTGLNADCCQLVYMHLYCDRHRKLGKDHKNESVNQSPISNSWLVEIETSLQTNQSEVIVLRMVSRFSFMILDHTFDHHINYVRYWRVWENYNPAQSTILSLFSQYHENQNLLFLLLNILVDWNTNCLRCLSRYVTCIKTLWKKC